MNHMNKKTELPVQVTLSTIDYAKLKVIEMPRVGQTGEPVAERTHFGWVLTSPGKAEITKLMPTKTSIDDYENLSGPDVLSISYCTR